MILMAGTLTGTHLSGIDVLSGAPAGATGSAQWDPTRFSSRTAKRAFMSSFYAVAGMCMVVAAVVWYVSPGSRRKIKRLALIAGLVALALAVAYNYAQKDDGAAPDTVDNVVV